MEYKDYYQILGVNKNSNANDIRSAFKKLAMKYHPDRNPDNKAAEEKFKEINEAYQVLSDPEKKARYDQLGSAYFDYQRGGGRPDGFDWSQWANSGGQNINFDELFGGGGFSDFFSAIFGGMGGMGGSASARPFQRQQPRRQNYEQEVVISLTEAFTGTSRILETNGRRLEVKIPAGSKTGTKVRIAAGATEGSDLYLRVKVAEDPRFYRDGDDLKTEIPVDMFTAVLGGEIEVTTMSGKVKLTIPAGTQPDQKIRLAGKGMPILKNSGKFGNLIAIVKVIIPKNISEEQRNLLQKAKEH